MMYPSRRIMDVDMDCPAMRVGIIDGTEINASHELQ